MCRLYPLCEAFIPDEARVSRKGTQRVPSRAVRQMLNSSLYRGQRNIGYGECVSGDHRRHPQIVLADGSRVYLDEHG
jgi:hypothetical protein